MLWERRMVDTARGSFEVFIKGEGEPICVTHLYSEFNESGDYFAESLIGNNSVFLVNLRETGRSARAEKNHQLSMLESVLDLEAVRTTLGFDQWYFAGHSTGGMLGLLYGVTFPERLTGLILVGTAARDYTVSPACIYHENHRHFHHMQELMEALKKADLTPDQRTSLSQERTKLSLHRPEYYDDFFNKPIQKKLSPIRLEFFSRELAIYDLTSKLHTCKCRVLVMCGRLDVQCPWEFSREIQELIPGSKLITYENSNHYPFLEERQLFLEDIHHFLTSARR
ncbi:alpha/beta fold hydrolase [Virgibacillus senegalensis]|uniref:alpha/beta fold hydrolase n=1 Tax=Virgibacillus senegalensis TaxID=1499679 RepID=UPI00069D1C72|nr:alpha/beta hydrolase [Virgibacillus senegalensis]